MPFIENPAPPAHGLAKWLNVAAAALSSALYDDTDEMIFVQEGIIDDLSDAIPPYAGADDGSLTIEASLPEAVGCGVGAADSGTLVFELTGAVPSPLSSSSSSSSSNSLASPLSTRWNAAVNTTNFSFALDGAGNTQGAYSYESTPWRYFTNGTSFVRFGATTGREVAMSAKCGPVTAKAIGEMNVGSSGRRPLFDFHSCAASIKLALPEDIFCGHVLHPKYLVNCQRNLYLGLSWEMSTPHALHHDGSGGGDTLRGTIAFNTIGYEGVGGPLAGGTAQPSTTTMLTDALGRIDSSDVAHVIRADDDNDFERQQQEGAGYFSWLVSNAHQAADRLFSPNSTSFQYGAWATLLLYKGDSSGRRGGGNARRDARLSAARNGSSSWPPSSFDQPFVRGDGDHPSGHSSSSSASFSSSSTVERLYGSGALNAADDDSLLSGGIKLVHAATGTELCLGAEMCESWDVDTCFGVRRYFSENDKLFSFAWPSSWIKRMTSRVMGRRTPFVAGGDGEEEGVLASGLLREHHSSASGFGLGFPFVLSFGRTYDGDWGASVAVSVVNTAFVLGAHRRSDAEGGLFGGAPTFGLTVSF